MTNPFHEPAESGDPDDPVWEDLVRRLQDPSASPGGPRAADTSGAVPADTAPGTATDAPADAATRGRPGTGGPVDPKLFTFHPALGGPRDYSEPEDEHDGGFVPEDPPALGSGNPLLNLAWIVAAGAPLMLLILAIVWRRAPMPLWIGLVVVAVAAIVFLFARLPRQRHEGDDGARV